MTVLGVIGGVLSVLATVLPTIMVAWRDAKKRRAIDEAALTARSLSELDRGAERVQSLQDQLPPVQ